MSCPAFVQSKTSTNFTGADPLSSFHDTFSYSPSSSLYSSLCSNSHTISLTSYHHPAPTTTNIAALDALYPPSHYDRSVATFTYPLTITTAYFPFPSKHSSTNYHQWLANFLSLNPTPIVIYTTPAFYPHMAAIRYNHLFTNCNHTHFTLNTLNSPHLVPCQLQHDRSLTDFPTHFNITFASPLALPITSLYSSYWESQLAMDPERKKHTPTLYATWNAKAYLVNRTATENPFHSKYFAWMDAGQFRNPHKPWQSAVDVEKLAAVFGESEVESGAEYREYNATVHPHPSATAVVSRQHKLLVNLVHTLPASYCSPVDPLTSFPLTLLSDHTAGQSFLGTAHAIHWYTDAYYRLLLSYQQRGVLWGKDQNVANGLVWGYKGSVIMLAAWKVSGIEQCVVGRGWDAHWSWMGEWLQQRGERSGADNAGVCPESMYDVDGMVVEGQTVCDNKHDHWLKQSEEDASKLHGPPAQVASAEAEQTRQRRKEDSG